MATPNLALIPTGYKAGKVYSVLPTPSYGTELITNGDFQTDSDWTKGTGWSISGDIASCNGSQTGNSNLTQGSVFSTLANKDIEISFTVSNYVAGSVRFISGNGALTHTAVFVNGVVTLYFNVGANTGTSFNIQGDSSFIGSIDNVSVKEVLVGSGDFDFTRASEATRINSAGLLEVEATGVPRLEYPLIDGVVNGCPSLLLEPQATNLITYPISFGNSYWTKSGATIEGDASTAGANLISSSTVNSSYTTFDGASADGFHAIWGSGTQRGGTADEIVFELGKMYKVEFNLSLASGDLPFLRVRIAIATSPVLFFSLTASGSNVFYFVCDSAITGLLEFTNSSASEYTISGLTTKEVQGYSSPSVDFPTSAFKLVEGTNTGGHNIQRVATVSNATIYTSSVFIKYGGREWIRFTDAQSSNRIHFNTLTGVFGTISGTVIDYNSTELGNGWYKLSLTTTSVATAYALRVSLAEIDNDVVYTGDGTSGVYLFMAQLETGSVATSPTLTSLSAEGTTTTRVAEVCNGAGDVNTFNSLEGVLMYQIKPIALDGTFKRITLSDGTSTNRVIMGFESNNQVVATVYNGSNQAVLGGNYNGKNELSKYALKYKENDFALWLNGFEIATDVSGNTFPNGTLNELAFEDGNGSNDFYGKTKQIQYFNTVLTSAELETLTSWTSFTAMANAQNYNII